MLVIFDLDGTLADIEHRRHLVDKEACAQAGRKVDWPEFFRQCVDDEPIISIIKTDNALHEAGHEIEIWSGRSDEVQQQYTCLVAQFRNTPTAVRMRPAGDHTPDEQLKESWLEHLKS